MASAIDFSGFSLAEQQALFAAAKTELLTRLTTGKVTTGGSSSQTFGMQQMTIPELQSLINSLTASLGYAQPVIQVAPNFAGTTWAWPNNP